jgi:hypothetical protein
MSETITEMVLPGTYIEVRSEGLIGVGGISTGNIGIVGTANRGPLNTPQVLGSYGEALEIFGASGAWPSTPAERANALSLTRSLEQVFRGGGSTVYAVRIAAGAPAAREFEVKNSSDTVLFTLTAKSPGTWANSIKASIATSSGEPATLTLELGRAKEEFVGTNGTTLQAAVADNGSRLVDVSPVVAGEGNKKPTQVTQKTEGGPDGGNVTEVEVAAGLAKLEQEDVQIVVVGGRDAKTIAGVVLAHLETTENEGRERMAVLGASSDDPATIISDDVSKVASARAILVAPGIVASDAATRSAVSLPGPYSAALVAGKLSTLAPQVSLTNKSVPASDLSSDYTRPKQKQLLTNRVMVLRKHLGFRALKGITTDTGAFKQISVRRIVDFAKAGVRQGANPYIGRLNNSRVLEEKLTGYELDVTATRAQEIRGEAQVTLMLKPTFSIDFIRVIMNLQ